MRLNFGPLPADRDIERWDPGYDEPGPLTTADFRKMLAMLPFAVVFVVGVLAGMSFFIVAYTPVKP